MRFFSRPPASPTRPSKTRWSTSWANRSPSPAPSAFPPECSLFPADRRATGCGSPDWPTPCRRCAARRSTSARAAEPWSRLPTSEERPTTVSRSRAASRALELVDFSVFPHLEREDMPDTSLANIERWTAGLSVPAYAIDDQSAISWSTAPSRSSPRGTGSCYPEPGSKLDAGTRRSTAPAFRNDAIGFRRAVHAEQHQGGSGGHRP
jgi:hypothetical protein